MEEEDDRREVVDALEAVEEEEESVNKSDESPDPLLNSLSGSDRCERRKDEVGGSILMAASRPRDSTTSRVVGSFLGACVTTEFFVTTFSRVTFTSSLEPAAELFSCDSAGEERSESEMVAVDRGGSIDAAGCGGGLPNDGIAGPAGAEEGMGSMEVSFEFRLVGGGKRAVGAGGVGASTAEELFRV